MTKASVLVVDDEALIRMELASRLEQAGYHVVEAGNSAEAIQVLETHSNIRVVFTDIQMPGTMDGLALSHYIRKRWPPTILILSSGNHTPSASELPSDTDFLAKPVANDVLHEVLVKLERKLSAM